MNNLVTRSITAFFFVAVMVGGVFWNVYSYGALMSLILIFCLIEYFDLVSLIRAKNKVSFLYKSSGILFGLSLFIASFLITYQSFSVMLYLPFMAILFSYFVLELFSASSTPMTNISLNLAGVVYITLPFVMLNHIAISAGGYEPRLVLGILFLVWVNDAGAYAFGSLFGKHKLFERISPNKTIEGLGGGILGCLVIAWLQYLVFGIFDLSQWMVIALIISVFATFGDLIVSMFKRSLKIKDTGAFFPGHGGFLDRFDAFIFAVPFVSVYMVMIR